MKPSEKAIEAAFSDVKGWEKHACIDSLRKAYAIDVDPLIEAKDKEIERLTSERNNFWKFYTDGTKCIAELEAEIERLRELCEVYAPKTELLK